MTDRKALKSAMIRAARRAYDIRLQSGDGGNLSVRIPGEDLLLIKASGCSFGDMGEDDIVLADFNGRPVEGGRRPSREIRTHLAIYRGRPDVAAIFHSHSPWSVACAQVETAVPAISLPLQMKIGEVPVLDADISHADDKAARAVADLLKTREGLRAFIQRRHGLFCMAADIVQAEHDAELVEDAAQIALLSRLAGSGNESQSAV